MACTCIFNMKVNHYPRSLQITKARDLKLNKNGKSGVNDFSRFFFSLFFLSLVEPIGTA